MTTDVHTIDVLFIADHFILITTVEVIDNTENDVEQIAWDRLSAEYGVDWVTNTRKFINKVTIEVVDTVTFTPNPTIDDIMKAIQEGKPSDE